MNKWHWSVWVRGLAAAAVSSAATGVSAALVVPGDVQAVHPLLIWKIAAVGAVVGVANYLKQSPLPAEDTTAQ
jgi:hypothetical protein